MTDCRTSFDSETAGSREGGTIRAKDSAPPFEASQRKA